MNLMEDPVVGGGEEEDWMGDREGENGSGREVQL